MFGFSDLSLLIISIIGIVVISFLLYNETQAMNKIIQVVVNIPSDQVELEHVGFRITRDGTDFNWPVFKIKDTDLVVTKSRECANAENTFSNEIPLQNIKESNHSIQKNELLNDIKARKKVIIEQAKCRLSYSQF